MSDAAVLSPAALAEIAARWQPHPVQPGVAYTEAAYQGVVAQGAMDIWALLAHAAALGAALAEARQALEKITKQAEYDVEAYATTYADWDFYNNITWYAKEARRALAGPGLD